MLFYKPNETFILVCVIKEVHIYISMPLLPLAARPERPSPPPSIGFTLIFIL